MSIKNYEIAGSVPTIADGNPTTLMAVNRSAEREGIDLVPFELDVVSRAARPFHHRVTNMVQRAEEYTKNSESDRAGWKGKLFGAASFGEFACRKFVRMGNDSIQWNVVQEMPLLGAKPSLLKLLGVDDIRLLTPDTFPKESGVNAVNRHRNARISVWNQEAFDELTEKKIHAELHRPYLLDGLRPMDDDFQEQGAEVIVKTSGSGMPDSWPRLLEIGVQSTNLEYAIHTPTFHIHNNQVTQERAFIPRTEAFYNDLGGRTRLLIGYPSELVGVAFELRSRGVPVWMLSLPPRGAHEWRNLEFGYRNGVIHSEIDVSGVARSASIPGLPHITIAEIPEILKELPEPLLEPGLLGKKSLWE